MIHRCEARQSSSAHVCQRQIGHERRTWTFTAFLHTILLPRVDLRTSFYDLRVIRTPLGYSIATMTIHRCESRQSSSTYVGQTQIGHERGIWTFTAFLHTILLSRVDLSTSSFASSGHLYGYSIATMMIHRCESRQSSSLHSNAF